MKQAPSITQEELILYGNFSTVDELPANYEKLTSFASDLVMYAVKNNYNPSSDAHVLAVKKAVCCQVSYWVETGTNPLNEASASSYSLGELSVSVNPTSPHGSESRHLCPLSTMYLKDCYLLYRGLRHGRI